MLKFTKSRPQHTHPRHQGGKGGRRLRPSSVCHRGCRSHIPHSGGCRPQPRGLRASLLFGSVLAAGSRSPSENPCSPLPPLCRCGPAWAGRRQTLLASPSNLTRNTPRGRSKLRQRSPGCCPNILGPGSRRAACAVGSETPESTSRPEAGAAKPGTRRAMPRPGICSLARCERAAWGQGQERGKSSPASTHPRRIFRAP